jgi:hypothetical protein
MVKPPITLVFETLYGVAKIPEESIGELYRSEKVLNNKARQG